jgi:ABC-type lipoprotein export system ATPase subunit
MAAPLTLEQRLAEVRDPGGDAGTPRLPLVRFEGAARSFGHDAAARVALRETDCEVPAGARIALMGPSGSGKSTFLHLMAGLDEPTVGSVDWPGIGPREALRPGPIALIFQGPSLIPALSVAENVALPLVLGGSSSGTAADRADQALARLGLEDLRDKLPEEISGGQAQRVAACRALAGEPRLILADEPTGQLDHTSGAQVVELLLEAADHAGAALVLSTHDPAIASRVPTHWRLADGVLTTGVPVMEASR